MTDADFLAGCKLAAAVAVLGAADLLYHARRRRFDGRAEAGEPHGARWAVDTRSDPGHASAGLSRPVSFFGARTAAATGQSRDAVVSSPMGKRSCEERPPRLWPCEKGVSAAFEPRNADRRTPRDKPARAEASTGVTAGETALLLSHEDDDMRLVVLATVGAAVLALVLGGGYYVAAWIVEQPRRIGGVLVLAAGVAVMVAAMRRMTE